MSNSIKEKISHVKSPLNYIGGKYKLLSQISPKFPENIEVFFDVFAGGCNVGVNASYFGACWDSFGVHFASKTASGTK